MLNVGEEAPSFHLRDHHDKLVSLSDFAGQRVVLYFYPRADTPGCTTEACGFRDAWEDYKALGVAVLGVSDDSVSVNADFAEKHDLPFRLLSDPEGDVGTRYDSYGEKQMFGRTFDGVYRTTYLVDPDGRIEAVYPDVDPEGHAEAILADIDESA